MLMESVIVVKGRRARALTLSGGCGNKEKCMLEIYFKVEMTGLGDGLDVKDEGEAEIESDSTMTNGPSLGVMRLLNLLQTSTILSSIAKLRRLSFFLLWPHLDTIFSIVSNSVMYNLYGSYLDLHSSSSLFKWSAMHMN